MWETLNGFMTEVFTMSMTRLKPVWAVKTLWNSIEGCTEEVALPHQNQHRQKIMYGLVGIGK